MLYSDKEDRLTDVLDNAKLLQYLTHRKIDIGFIHFNGKMGLWTENWCGIIDLFETGNSIKLQFESKKI